MKREVALVDLLDRVLAGGVVVTGDITLAIADVDLVRISLRAVVTSVHTGMSLEPVGRSRPAALPAPVASPVPGVSPVPGAPPLRGEERAGARA
ncbi:gas vesicle protein [Dactylosporangium roseum]|uniref:Gas vesicle protein n=1 Tax=Dactylosporangium roseum TaxID=47989 RepID=A0ABY5YYU9_9ACTN|nr:gas vesicle protein [Dactylosporangium roseum]UWZ33990.1 gas vesicle protein [Dactylosporangium roseum]